MSKLIATLVASMFAVAAYAQTNATPPVLPATGTSTSPSTKMGMKKDEMKKDDTMAAPSDKKAARKARHNARKMKRDQKEGDKPVN